MLVNILIFLVSIIPSVLIIIWLNNRRKGDLLYRKSCKSALLRGIISVLPIIGVSGLFFIITTILRATVLREANVLIYQAIYKFIVLAFAEELVKFLALRLLLKKKINPYSWVDVAAYMVIIGTTFGLLEDIPYAIDSSPIVMLVRGFTMGHVGYAFIMGWFYGKRLYTGKKRFGVISLLLPFLLHGIYDFSLTPELIAVNDNLAVIGVTMAIVDLVLLALMIRFFKRSRKTEFYNEPIKLDQPARSYEERK